MGQHGKIALLSESPVTVLEFRARPWPHQCTFETPRKNLGRFVSAFLASLTLESAAIVTDTVVFEPRALLSLFERYGIQTDDLWDFILQADDQQAIAELLEAMLSDWVDFILVPAPQHFVIYADHDQYVTFYAPSVTSLRELTDPLVSAGFTRVNDYVRPSSEYWK